MVRNADQPLVAPFVGERYAARERLSRLLAPPYDVISPAERRILAGRDEHNVVHLILPAGEGNRYAEAAGLLERWRRHGVLERDERPSVYVVEQVFTVPGGQALTRRGVIAAVAAEPFASGRVKPHERTHAGPKQDRLDLMRTTRTMFEGLLMLSRDGQGELARLSAEVVQSPALATGEVRDAAVRLWRVDGAQAQSMAAAASREALYIADGHHRFETAVAFRREYPAAERTLALIVSLHDPGLVVLATHRLIHGVGAADRLLPALDAAAVARPLEGSDPGRALAEAAESGAKAIVVLAGGRMVEVRPQPGVPAAALEAFDVAVRSLDVTWADACVVAPLRELAGGKPLSYSSSVDEVMASVTGGGAVAGVLLNPPRVEDVLAVADAGAYMPQKSTYFLPKVPSGLVFLPS